jgi:F0F1-type ATP synthase assembly protein I
VGLSDLGDRQHLYNGFGNSMARAIELVVTPVLFGLIGFGLDRWLGIAPVLTIILTLFALIGMGVRSYYGYDKDMAAAEADRPWARVTEGRR